jgi:transposase
VKYENRAFFSDAKWEAIAATLSNLTSRGPKGNPRHFVEAVIWILRSGAPWRDLAERFGNWQRIYRRYRRWALAGRWEALRRAVTVIPRRQRLLIDSTIVKAHPHAAGALRRTGGQGLEALGRSRGGFTTKLHALVTESGQLVRYLATGGEVHDVTQAKALVHSAGERIALVGDRAYDSDALIDHLESLEMKAVIPSRSHRKVPRTLDVLSYARRNVIERWFGRLKTFRRVATRYDKTSRSYLGFVAAAASLISISGWPSPP